ncbi:hypothetical protein [Nostoc sp.]
MIAYYHCDSIAIAGIGAMAKIYQWVGIAQTSTLWRQFAYL